jgi:hypothetical protein
MTRYVPGYKGPKPPPATQQPSGLRSVPMSLAQQQAQYDKNMQQAQSLPPAERAKFAEQFQRAAAAGDKSTIRPGTVFGDGSGISQVKPKGLGSAVQNTVGMAGNIGRIGGSLLGGLTQARPTPVPQTRPTPTVGTIGAKPTGIGAAAVNAANKMGMGASAVNKLGSIGQAVGKKLGMKKGGAVKKMASGGSVSSASKRGDGCAIKGKTKGRMV